MTSAWLKRRREAIMQYQTVSPTLERKSERPAKSRPLEILVPILPPQSTDRSVRVMLPATDSSASGLDTRTFVQRYALFIAVAAFAGALIVLALVQPYLPGVPQ